jgi:hypothetical protein
VSMDQTYLTTTEYNLFTLLRQGNEFSVYEPVSASFFFLLPIYHPILHVAYGI